LSDGDECPACAEDRMADEIERLRAALRRCHSLIEAASSWVDVYEYAAWHTAAEAELLACDEAGECPTPPPTEGRDTCCCGNPNDKTASHSHDACVGPTSGVGRMSARYQAPPEGRVVVAEGLVEWDEQYSGNFKVIGAVETVAVAIVANEVQAELVRNVGHRVRVVVERVD